MDSALRARQQNKTTKPATGRHRTAITLLRGGGTTTTTPRNVPNMFLDRVLLCTDQLGGAAVHTETTVLSAMPQTMQLVHVQHRAGKQQSEACVNGSNRQTTAGPAE